MHNENLNYFRNTVKIGKNILDLISKFDIGQSIVARKNHILGIDGICTKLKYHNKPIHIIPVNTCKYLNNQLKKYLSKANPSPKKCNPKSNKIAIPKDK